MDSESELYVVNDEVPGVKQCVIHLNNLPKYLKNFLYL